MRAESQSFAVSGTFGRRAHELIPGGQLVPAPGRSCMACWTRDRDLTPSQAFRSLFPQETIRRRILMPSVATGQMHRDHDIESTIETMDGVLAVQARALADSVARHLVGRPPKTVYRRYNRMPVAVPARAA
jgi:hypothetical protein